ncbi:AAA family ATPase [Spirosoma rhododendri]|uniref:AAA family ATPase n=1 Tax=Spirosoma rhododendri TaxID=2728024 RepID=A0A7L5DZ71_9BACT|nr:AAA family ATPase [Spirosoma rhododendri]QJD81287.1 AAA family ATPase [Spirosoma rhododendri]
MLKRVSIQNFKSLKDVELELQKVNLLIGPNNSGKTNFLKALAVCNNLIRGESIEVSDNFNKNSINKIYLKLSFDDKPFENLEGTFTHINYAFTRNTWGEGYKFYYGLSDAIDSEMRHMEFPALNGKMDKFFRIGYIYKPDPNKLDKPSPVGRGSLEVATDASNLIAFFDRIRDEYPGTFAQIKADLAKCVPEFTEINFQNVESTEELVKQFGDKTFKRIGLTDGRQNIIYWADELSEGTLYFIALLCIINQPNPPKLLLLEEPEKGIHPRRIFEVIQFIFRLAEEKDVQVIMTTHSPIVVDMFKDMPESVFIFDKDDEGATHVKNLQRDVIEPEAEKSKELGIEPHHYTDSLGDAWTVGFLGGVPK